MTIDSIGSLLAAGTSQSGSILRSAQNSLRNPQARRIGQIVGGVAAVLAICSIGYGLHSSMLDPMLDPPPAALQRSTPSPSQAPPGKASTLDRELLIAALLSDNPNLCRFLISQKADPNARNANGQNSLQVAIFAKNWLTCKALIDNGANSTDEDFLKIRKYLWDREVCPLMMHLFTLRFPNPYEPEIFMNGEFQSLAKFKYSRQESNRLPLAIYHVCEEDVNSNYGATSRKFSKNYSKLNQIAEHFNLIRVHVNDKEQLVPTIDKITKLLPELLLTLCIFDCHGTRKIMQIGINSRLTCDDDLIMEEVGKRIVPSGKLVLAGCNNGRESMEEHSDPFSLTTSDHPSSSVSDMNIAESFSNNAPTLIVYASPDLIYNMTPSVFHLPSSSFPEFLPYFKVGPIDSSRYFKGPIGSSRKVRAYMKGRKVAEGGPSDGVADKLRLLLLDQINLDIKKPRDLSITG